jgi:competence CoiA-like predicted nuclease
MPKYTAEQMLKSTVTLNPKQARALRDLGVELDYRCPGCNEPVKVAAKGSDQKAHFKHIKRNRSCRYGVGIKRITAQA